MMIERSLKAVNKKIAETIDRKGPILRGLYDDSSLDDGKRLRAKLFFSFSGKHADDAIKIAAAIELLHAATLIHDDVLDDSILRRGRKALHVSRGVPTSILYGDYLFSQSFLLLSDAGNSRLWKEAVRALSEALKGEMEEQHRRGDMSLTRREYLGIVRKKSGTLFGLACKAGLILRRADPLLIENVYKFGICIGTAYQILDDCNDYLNHNDGRGRFSDFKKGVMTLPMIYLLNRCSGSERSFIADRLGKAGCGTSDMNNITALIRRYEVVCSCCRDARHILAVAKHNLSKRLSDKSRRCLDIAVLVEEKINYAEKEYCHSGERVRGC